MSTIRHPIIREHPIIQPPPFGSSALDMMTDPFRDPAWRDSWLAGGRHASSSDPFRDWPAVPAVRDPHRWRDSHSSHSGSSGYYRDTATVPRDFYNHSRDNEVALVPAASSALPLSRSFFNPERQLSLMDGEMSRMAMEMKRMHSDMQHLMPIDSDPDSWRLKENFLLENPIVHDNEGNRMFRLKFDVRQFRPEEIFVKTMGNELVVHAKHEEKGKDKSLHREYKRLYVLPKDLPADHLQSKLTRDGVLSIEAKLPPKEGNGRDRLIPIKHE